MIQRNGIFRQQLGIKGIFAHEKPENGKKKTAPRWTVVL
jgi:hypothetical protein